MTEFLSSKGRKREEIYVDIEEERPYVLRHENTRRVWDRCMNALLGELVEIQYQEAVELLEEEANESAA